MINSSIAKFLIGTSKARVDALTTPYCMYIIELFRVNFFHPTKCSVHVCTVLYIPTGPSLSTGGWLPTTTPAWMRFGIVADEPVRGAVYVNDSTMPKHSTVHTQ